MATAVTVAALAIVAVAAGAPGEVSDAFEKFKSREGAVPSEGSRGEQILDVSSSGRYDFWQSAIDANKTEPLTGIGPGTFEFWWSREGSYPGFVRDAHSLYFETLAELGWVGLILVGGFVLGVLGIGVARAIRAPDDLRLALAAAVAGCTAFAATALVDWVWELAVIPVVFLALAAIAVAAGREAKPPSSPRLGRLALRSREPQSRRARPRGAGRDLDPPCQRRRRGRKPGRFRGRRRGDSPSSGPPTAARSSPVVKPIHPAGIRLGSGRRQGRPPWLRSARRPRNEPTNWRTWFVRSGIEARAGNADESVEALRRARSLNGSGAIAAYRPRPPLEEAP